MATQHQRRPDGKEVPQPDQKVSLRHEAEVDAKAKETQRQLEKGEAAEVSPEVAAAMQRGMGNSAVQGVMKGGSETSTATSSAEAALDEVKEKEPEEEQEKEVEAGEIEHVLPIFSTGGGGGGGGGAPGASPWAVGKYFGGDDDSDPDEIVVEGPKWRPMPFLPDPDEDDEIEAVPAEAEGAAPERPAFAEADLVLGCLPWRASPLSRGLRHPALLARRVVSPEMLGGGVSAVWLRARLMLRFLATHADLEPARTVAASAAELGVPEGSLATAIAQELAMVEAVLTQLAPAWDVVIDIAVDERARARCEQAAANRARAGVLNAPDLLASVTESTPVATASEWVEVAHPAVVAALHRAARISVMPALELWSPPISRPVDDDLLAFDEMVAAAIGGPAPARGVAVERAHVSALFSSMNAVLGALGAVQVEAAAAAVALSPHVPVDVLSATLLPLDGILRQSARRLVASGRAIEALIGTDSAAEVRALSGEAAAVRGLAEFGRQGAFLALAGHVSVADSPVAGAVSARADALLELGRARAAGEECAGSAGHVLRLIDGEHAPYSLAFASACLGKTEMISAAKRLCTANEPGALSLLKARFAEGD